MKRAAAFFIICYLLAPAARAEEAPAILIRIMAQFRGQRVWLRVIDKQTGKKAVLPLLAGPDGKDYRGEFRLGFNNRADSPDRFYFELLNKVDERLFPVFLAGGSGEVLLFRTEAEATAATPAAPQERKKGSEPKKDAERKRDAERKSEEERLSLELRETTKRESLIAEQSRLSEAERQSRARQALAFINQAGDLYARGEYKESTYSYAKAIDLFPSSDDVYYKYGVGLYKSGEYNKSLAVLSLSEAGAENRAEYDYYVALNYMKLAEYDGALEKFRSVVEENDKQISPMAAYLAGTIEFQIQKYSEAKTDFEFVLDNSSDSQLDAQAEKMIEEIDRIENFLASAKEKMRYSFNFGTSFDSNVLNISQTNLATNAAAYRGAYGGSFLYKLTQSYKSEWAAQISYADIYSVDGSFKSSTTVQTADPSQMALSLPFRSQFERDGRNYLYNVTPSISSISMNLDGTTRKQILQSTTVDSDISFQFNPVWISAFRWQINQDQSYVTSTGGDDDPSGLRNTLGTTQTYLLDAKGIRTLSGDLSYAANAAKGKNNTYAKSTAGVIYGFAGPLATQSSLKIDSTTASYNDNSNNRVDSIYSATISASKAFKKSLALATSLQFVSSNSNIESNKYDKYVFAVLLIYSGSINKD